jgi:Saxitoxin biosynthesis operon protein SxtJ
MVPPFGADSFMAASDPVVSHRKVVMGSNRSFGLVFAAVFAAIALLPAIHGAPIRMWALAVAAAFAAAALLVPRLLYPLNRAWFALGLLLHHIVNPVIMAVLFYGAILPMALLLRLLGKDLLRLKRDEAATSYWITRDPPGPAAGSMSKQF